MRTLVMSIIAIWLAVTPHVARGSNESARAQLSWSATSLVTDLAAPGASATLALQLTSGVTSFKGGECEIRWRPLGDSNSCFVRSGALFRTSAGTVCTYLNRGTAVAFDLLDVPGDYHVTWTNPQALSGCAAGTIVLFTFDLSGCTSPAASFSLCSLSLEDANGGVTALASGQLGVPATLAGGGGFTASCANPPVVDVRDTTIAPGDTLRVTPWVHNPDGFALAWSAAGLPAGASIDAASGQLTWVTTGGQAGLVAGIIVTATDSRLASGSDSMTVIVATGLTLAALADTAVDELRPVPAQPRILGDHGTVTWDGIGLPAGASVDPVTGKFMWTPDRFAGNSGLNLHTITLRARESVSVFGQTSFLVTVRDANTPPVIGTAPSDTSVCAGGISKVSFAASDAEGKVTYGGTDGLPDWVSVFNSSKKGLYLDIEPGYADAGVYSGGIWVLDDEGLSDTTTWTVTVLDDSLAPVITPIPDQTIGEGDTLVVTPQWTNPRPLDTLSWGITFAGNYPTGASQDPITGVFTFAPPSSCIEIRDSYEVQYYLKNQHCGTGLDTFVVHVVRKPIVICTTTALFCTTRLITVPLMAAGADATPLTWSSPDLPSWALLTSGGMLSGFAPTGTSGRDTFTVIATNSNSGSTGYASFIATFSECTAAAGLTAGPASAVRLDAQAPPFYVLRFGVVGDLRRAGITPARVTLTRDALQIAASPVAGIVWDATGATVSFAREDMVKLLAGVPRARDVVVSLEVSDDRGVTLAATLALPVSDVEQMVAYPIPSRGQVWLRLPADLHAGDEIAVYSTVGTRVRLLARVAAPIPRLLRWDGRLDDGQLAPAGIYYARTGGAPHARIVLLR